MPGELDLVAVRRVLVQPVHAHRCLLIAGLFGDPDPPEESEDLFLCSECGRWFPTLAGCKIHAAKQHGLSSEASLKARLAGTQCPVCFTEFHSRARLVQHLRARSDRVNACRDVFDLGVFDELDQDTRTAADARNLAHLRQCRAGGINPLAIRGRACRPL